MRKGLLPVSTTRPQGPGYGVPGYMRFAAILFRSLFIIALLIVTAWVSSPQFGSNWLEHFSLGDFIRVTLGALACLWMFVNLFILPKDAQGYRTWTYLGLAIMPLALLCFIVFWW